MNVKHPHNFVLDCSVTMTWLFQNEATPAALKARDLLCHTRAKVPSIWPLEVSNVLQTAVIRHKITPADQAEFIHLLSLLPIDVDPNTSIRCFKSIHTVATTYSLTSYDAAYLDLTMYQGLSLATLDTDLQKAAKSAGVMLL